MIFYDDGRYNEQYIMNEANDNIDYYIVQDKDEKFNAYISSVRKNELKDSPKKAIIYYLYLCRFSSKLKKQGINTDAIHVDEDRDEINITTNDKNLYNRDVVLYKFNHFMVHYVKNVEVFDTGKIFDLAKKYGVKINIGTDTELSKERLDVYNKVIASLKKAVNNSPYKSKIKFINNNSSKFVDENNGVTENLKTWLICETNLIISLRIADTKALNLSTADTNEYNEFSNMVRKAYQDAHVKNASDYNLSFTMPTSTAKGFKVTKNDGLVDYIYLDDLTVE